MSNKEDATPKSNVAADAHKAVVEAYYPSVLALADAVRTRAQNAWTIASAVAGGVVAAGALSHIENRGAGVLMLSGLSLLAWLTTAGAFMWVVAAPATPDSDSNRRWRRATPQKAVTYAREAEFAEKALANILTERGELQRRQNVALCAFIAALAFTFIAIASAAWPRSGWEQGSVVPTQGELISLTPTCDLRSRALHGQIQKSSIGGSVVRIRVGANSCRGERELDLPAAGITAVVLDH